MSLRIVGVLGAGLALLASTPSFAFSIVSKPVINDYSALSKHFDSAGGSYFQAANSGMSPTARAGAHGVMVTYDLTAKASKSRPSLDRDAIADHSADPQFNPFLGGEDMDRASPTADSSRSAQAR